MKHFNFHRLGIPLMIILSIIVMNACNTLSDSGNWPQFRGPDVNMIAIGENLPVEWGDNLNVAWTYNVEGEGWASPVVWGNRVMVSTVVAELINKPGEGEEENEDLFRSDEYRWLLSCVDLDSGQEIWKKEVHRGNPRTDKHRNTSYASETPVTDGERIFLYLGMHGLYCFDMEGELLWEKDLGAYETLNGWGTGSSPLLYNGMLYVQVDNEEYSFLVALDPESGDETWKTDRDETTSYSTPYIWENKVRTELVTGGYAARSYDPATGELLWELQMEGRYNIPGPVATKDLLYIGNPGRREIPGSFFAVKAGAEGDITPDSLSLSSEGLAWFNLDAPTGNPSPLLYEGLVYLLSSRGGDLTCLDSETGELVYQEKVEGVGACWASPWAHGDKIFFTDEKGVTKVIKAGKEFEFLHENSLDDRFWASMATTGEAYLFKGDNKLFCIKE
jgi:outer membrane protein assembly factor BamB